MPDSVVPGEVTKGETTSIQTARFFDDLVEPIRQVLENHGARLEVLEHACVIHVPVGTMRQRLYPVVVTDRYEITLPDGYKFYQSQGRKAFCGVSFLVDEFPEWVQRKYG